MKEYKLLSKNKAATWKIKKKEGKKEIEIIGENHSTDDNIPVTMLGSELIYFFLFCVPVVRGSVLLTVCIR